MSETHYERLSAMDTSFLVLETDADRERLFREALGCGLESYEAYLLLGKICYRENDLARAVNPNHAGLGWVDRCDRCHLPRTWNQAEINN